MKKKNVFDEGKEIASRTYDVDLEVEKEKIKLKDDGNVTRQMLDAIGFETLQSMDDHKHGKK